MTTSAHWVLLLEPSEGTPSLATRAHGTGLTVRRAASVEAAIGLLRFHPGRVATLVHVAVLEPDPGPGIGALRRATAPGRVEVVPFGRRPPEAACAALRAGGVALALWEPFDDGTLRFQLKRALHGVSRDEERAERRVPTPILARVRKGDRESSAVVYDLSVGGAFLETPRPSLRGARVDLVLPLPERTIETQADVRYANVPGNLKRPLLPLGMGVQFCGLPGEDRAALAQYVESRARALRV